MSDTPTRRRGAAIAASQLPAGWQAAFLTALESHGGKYRAAREVGVRWRDVLRAKTASPAFADQIDEAMGLFADSVEDMLIDPTNKNVVGTIVRMKALRPDQYIERRAEVVINHNTMQLGGVSEADATALLKRMLLEAQPETVQRLLGLTTSKGE